MTKRDNSKFDSNNVAISIILKALGHPARVGILEHLLTVKRCNCNEFVGRLPLSQPSVSQHIKALKSAEIISCEREGLNMFCSLNPKILEKVENYFSKVNRTI